MAHYHETLPFNPPPGGYQRPKGKQGRNRRRRNQVFNLLLERHGFVPCFVCGMRVERDEATIEHIIPLSRGGRRGLKNLSISHGICNWRRGAPEVSE